MRELMSSIITHSALRKRGKNMINPFKYSGISRGETFCNRKKEIADLVRTIENSENLFVYSERRIGKTSLIKRVLEELPNDHYISAYVDLWPTDGEHDFVNKVAKAIAESMSTTVEKVLKVASALFGRLTPTITIDEEGKPVVSFGIGPEKIDEVVLEEVMEAPMKIAEKESKKVVVVFDEFQQILEYGDDLVERKLRSIIQFHDKVSYIFLGSRKHLIKKMFLDKSVKS